MVGLDDALRLGLRVPERERPSSVRLEVDAVGEGGQCSATGEREGSRNGEAEVDAVVAESGADRRNGWWFGVGQGIW